MHFRYDSLSRLRRLFKQTQHKVRMSKSGGAPSAAERKVCHLSRDAFFACLEQHNDRNSCLKEKAKFEENCPKSWVSMSVRKL